MMFWKKLLPMILAFILVGAVWVVYFKYFKSPEALVVYCAHDAIYSDQVLDRFTEKTGIEVIRKNDTEATKALGLVELLVREKAAPRCDVFWNNELLGMIQLQEEGVLEPWKGSGYQRIPDKYKDPSGDWTGFAARARVYIQHVVAGKPLPPPLSVLGGSDLSRTAIAKPLYGTTLTHYAALWARWGKEATQKWHFDCRSKGMREVNGNSVTKELVANGVCDLGFTDTDDFFGAKDDGADVTMTPVRLSDGATICIPNTVAVIRGTRHRKAARQLVDFLLSEESELALARSASRQIPLGSVDPGALPADVSAMVPWLEAGIPLNELSAARTECLAWLKSLDD